MLTIHDDTVNWFRDDSAVTICASENDESWSCSNMWEFWAESQHRPGKVLCPG